MRLLSALVFLGGSLTVTSSRAPPPNKEFTQQHSEIIDAVAREEPNGGKELASKMFKQRGLEELALSTIRRYLNQARERMAQSESPGDELSESAQDESIQSVPVPSEDEPLISTHAVVRSRFTPAHEVIMLQVFASHANLIDSKKELFDIASIEFEKIDLNPVSFRSFAYKLDSAGLSSGYGRTFGKKANAGNSKERKKTSFSNLSASLAFEFGTRRGIFNENDSGFGEQTQSV